MYHVLDTPKRHKNGVPNSSLHREKVLWYPFGWTRSSIRPLINWLAQNPDASSYVHASTTMVQAYIILNPSVLKRRAP